MVSPVAPSEMRLTPNPREQRRVKMSAVEASPTGTISTAPSPTMEQLKQIAAKVQKATSQPLKPLKKVNNMPVTKRQIEEFDLAFSTRPKLPRTPYPGDEDSYE